MVDKFLNILEKIRNEKGDVTFLGILKMDEFSDKWTVLLSARWSSELTRKEDFEYIRNLLRSNLSSEELSGITRLGILPEETHLIQLLLNYQTGTEFNKDTKINGNIIHEGYIVVSNKTQELPVDISEQSPI